MDISETTDMSGVWDTSDDSMQLGTIEVKIPQIGTFVWYKGEEYQILSTVTYQTESPESGQYHPKSAIGTLCTLAAIDEEGEQIPTKELIQVSSGDLRLI